MVWWGIREESNLASPVEYLRHHVAFGHFNESSNWTTSIILFFLLYKAVCQEIPPSSRTFQSNPMRPNSSQKVNRWHKTDLTSLSSRNNSFFLISRRNRRPVNSGNFPSRVRFLLNDNPHTRDWSFSLSFPTFSPSFEVGPSLFLPYCIVWAYGVECINSPIFMPEIICILSVARRGNIHALVAPRLCTICVRAAKSRFIEISRV